MMEIDESPTPSGIRSPRYISLDRALPISAACQACRSKHQRCDGVLPICLRCKKGNKSCNYAPSRRGQSVAHLRPKKRKASGVRTPASENITEGLDAWSNCQHCPSSAHKVVIMRVLISLSSINITNPWTFRRRRRDTAEQYNGTFSYNGFKGRYRDS